MFVDSASSLVGRDMSLTMVLHRERGNMSDYALEISSLRSLMSSRQKKRSKTRIDVTNEDEIMDQDSGIEEAIDALEGGQFGKDYSTQGTLIKNFRAILDSTGKKTKEGSKISPVVKAVEALNDKSFCATLTKNKVGFTWDNIQKPAKELLNACDEYENSVGNPWSTSGKQRKALVKALNNQVEEMVAHFKENFGGEAENSYIWQRADKAVKKEGGGSWADLMYGSIEQYSMDTRNDISNMSSDEVGALRDEIMKNYGLTGEEADRLLNNRKEISSSDIYFEGSGAVTADLVRKLASQFNEKKELKAITGGDLSGHREMESMEAHIQAAKEAKAFCTKRYGIKFDTLDNVLGRVLASLMDISGTQKALRNNALIYKQYMTTRNNKDGGFYWDIITDFLDSDLSIFENRDPKFMLSHHNEIFDACEVGSEVFQNVLPKMKRDTGVEPDEDTMNNITALASFMMDYTMYNTGIWDFYGSTGVDFIDLDQADSFGDMLDEQFGTLKDGESGNNTKQGVNAGMDVRLEKYEKSHSQSFDDQELSTTMGGFIKIKQYKLASFKGSVHDLLRTMYGWKDLGHGPGRKETGEAASEETVRKMKSAGLL